MATFAVILPAAGSSSRFKDPHYKPFATLGDRAVWLHSVEKFVNRDDVKQVIVVISPEDAEMFQQRFGANAAILGIEVAAGGKERAESVENGLAKVRAEIDYVAVHDAARPCIAKQWIDRVFDAAKQTGAAILATPVSGTLKRVNSDNQSIAETVPRENIWEAQTPQVFQRQLLLDAYAARDGKNVTDEAQLIEQFGRPVRIVRGSPINFKITTKEDLQFAQYAIKALPKPSLLGPAHPFENDDMWR